MSSTQITTQMAQTMEQRATDYLFKRTETSCPECFRLKGFEHLMFETAEADALHAAFADRFPNQWTSTSTINRIWKIGPAEFAVQIYSRHKIRGPDKNGGFYRHRDPKLFDAWHSWLNSISTVFVETLVAVWVIKEVLGASESRWMRSNALRSGSIYCRTTAELRDTWPGLLVLLQGTGRDKPLIERTNRPRQVDLGPLAPWIDVIDGWITEGALRDRGQTNTMDKQLKFDIAKDEPVVDFNWTGNLSSGRLGPILKQLGLVKE